MDIQASRKVGIMVGTFKRPIRHGPGIGGLDGSVPEIPVLGYVSPSPGVAKGRFLASFTDFRKNNKNQARESQTSGRTVKIAVYHRTGHFFDRLIVSAVDDAEAFVAGPVLTGMSKKSRNS